MSLTPLPVYARAFAVAGRPNQMNAFQLNRSSIPKNNWVWREFSTFQSNKSAYVPAHQPTRVSDLPLIRLETRTGQYVTDPPRVLTRQHVAALIGHKLTTGKSALSDELIAELTAALLRGEIPDESALSPKCPKCGHKKTDHDVNGCDLCECEL